MGQGQIHLPRKKKSAPTKPRRRSKLEFPKVKTVAGYGNERGDGQLSWGVCRVQRQGDKPEHKLVQDIYSLTAADFATEIKRNFGPRPQVFIYIHGFLNSFTTSIQLGTCLAGSLRFTGPVVVYSWPSQTSPEKYPAAESNSQWTLPHFRQFLTALNANLAPQAIHLFAQSLGNRVLAYGLKDIYRDKLAQLPLGQVIFNAADLDAEIFKSAIFPEIHDKALRYTLYAARWDRPLALSKFLHAYPRAGQVDAQTGPYAIWPGLDTIDATELRMGFMGHYYYHRHPAIAEDVSLLIKDNFSPEYRSLPFYAEKKPSGRYWRLLDSKQHLWSRPAHREEYKIYYITDRDRLASSSDH